jgi:hypothetical protein
LRKKSRLLSAGGELRIDESGGIEGERIPIDYVGEIGRSERFLCLLESVAWGYQEAVDFYWRLGMRRILGENIIRRGGMMGTTRSWRMANGIPRKLGWMGLRGLHL